MWVPFPNTPAWVIDAHRWWVSRQPSPDSPRGLTASEWAELRPHASVLQAIARGLLPATCYDPAILGSSAELSAASTRIAQLYVRWSEAAHAALSQEQPARAVAGPTDGSASAGCADITSGNHPPSPRDSSPSCLFPGWSCELEKWQYCPDCGSNMNELEFFPGSDDDEMDDRPYCPECGSRVNDVKSCPDGGVETDEPEKCPECGSELNEAEHCDECHPAALPSRPSRASPVGLDISPNDALGRNEPGDLDQQAGLGRNIGPSRM